MYDDNTLVYNHIFFTVNVTTLEKLSDLKNPNSFLENLKHEKRFKPSKIFPTIVKF
jgi:hypothetical protein